MEYPTAQPTTKAQLQITRVWHLIGAARKSRIVMDDTEIATLGAGESVVLEVPAGRHVLYVRSASAAGPQSIVDFASGETVRLISKLGRLCSEDGTPLSDVPGTAVPAKQGWSVIISGCMSLWAGLTNDWRSVEDRGALVAMNHFFGWVLSLSAVYIGITQLRYMYSGKVSRDLEVPVWIGTILGSIALLLHIGGLVSGAH